jgi:hypothetical protein
MILLFAFGKKGYAQMAYNLAFSLKHFNPDLPITIYHDGILNTLDESQRNYFNTIIEENTLDISTFKTRLYELSPYEETLYLDVDGISLKDILPLTKLLCNKDFYVFSWGNHKLEMGNDMKNMRWAYANDLWEHFKLNPDAIVPGTQTSMIYFRKTEVAKKIFDVWKEVSANPMPLDKLREKWGGTQPDELYLNVALAQLNIPANTEQCMFFGNYFDNRTFGQLKDDFYFLSIYGGVGNTRKRYWKWYNQLIKEYHRSYSIQAPFQYENFFREKHVQANKQPLRPARNIQRAIPIARTTPSAITPRTSALPSLKPFLVDPEAEINFTLIHPSRSRAAKGYSAMAQWMNNSANPEKIQYIFSLDIDDPEVNSYRRFFEGWIWEPEVIVGNNKNLVQAIEKVTSKPEFIKGKIIIVVSDDFECPLNWDKSLLEIAEGKENYAIRVNDGVTKMEASIMTIPMLSRELFLKLGYIYYPGYSGMFADNDLFEVCQKTGEILNAPQLLFKHQHWIGGNAKRDETYNRHNNNKSWTLGESLLKDRRKRNFDLQPQL